MYITNSEVCTVLARWHNSRLTCWLQLVNIWASSAVPWEALAAVFLFLIMGHAETKRCVCVCELQGFLHHHMTHLFHIMILQLRKRCFLGSLPLPVSFSSPNTSTVKRVAAQFPTRWYFCGSSFSSSEFECESHGPFSYGTWVLHKYLLFPFWILRASKVFFYNRSKLTGLAGQIWTHKFLEGFSWLYSGTLRYKHIPLQDQARNSRCSYFESFFPPHK